ncbi:Unannotated [Lentimonas sp. CC19]|nr:Unannotated [Lentimonas sp. CC10]CAA6693979.1 Unannotated [Lentimonas sp. CC19]CAA7070250.1 Unannotated [Lentimonas sp. CC11]
MKAKLILLFFVSTLVLTISMSASDFRTFKSSDGRSIEGKIVSVDSSNKVSLKLSNGQSYNGVRLSLFSDEDQVYILEWEKRRVANEIAQRENAQLMPDSRLLIMVKSARDNDLNEKGDPDNREVQYEPALTIDNKEKDNSFKKVKGTLVFIGQSVLKKKEYHILYRQDFTLDLPAGERTKWKGKNFTNVYDDYSANGSAFGAEYEGYLVVLRDNEGSVRILKGSKSSWERDYKAILAADMRKGHSRDFAEHWSKTVY